MTVNFNALAENHSATLDEDYLVEQTDDDLRVLADANNCEVYTPYLDELTVDLDTPEDVEKFDGRLAGLIDSGFGLTVEFSWLSKSGNTHKVLILHDYMLYSVPEKCMIQVALGSDPKRESICLKRWRLGQTNVFRLFKPILTEEINATEDTTIQELASVDDS